MENNPSNDNLEEMMNRRSAGHPINSAEDLEAALDSFPEMMRREALKHQSQFSKAFEGALKDVTNPDDIGEV